MKLLTLGTAVVVVVTGAWFGISTLTPRAQGPDITFDVSQLSQMPALPLNAQFAVTSTSDAMNNRAAFLPGLPSLQRSVQRNGGVMLETFGISPWEATVASGDTLDVLLARANLDAPLRVEIASAIAAEYDLRKMRPGHRLSVGFHPDGSPSVVALAVDHNVIIEVTLNETITSRTVAPTSTSIERAGQLLVKGSIYESLDKAGVPALFATDLADILSDSVDFRRDLKGGENLSVLWAQSTLDDGSPVGDPTISYAALNLSEDRFEVIWPEKGEGQATVYLNGKTLQTAAAPVQGARLSSVFGRRKHPVFGSMRMHTGVDYAAAKGTPISATAPGRVSFIGWRGGYGRVVEVSHGKGTMTRYAHLSAVPKGMTTGKRVVTGEVIGRVGKTGTATGPNLHYEVRVDGRPIDPLENDRFAMVDKADAIAATIQLEKTRMRYVDTLEDETQQGS